MRAGITVAVVSILSICSAMPKVAQAEVAADEEMQRVCQNWLAYVVHHSGGWAGEINPEIVGVADVVSDSDDMVMARCFSISPQGHVVVPVLMELPPVKAYSEEYDLYVEQTVGFPQLLREVLEHRLNLFIETYGSLDASQPPDGDVLFDRVNREEWDIFLLEPAEFDARLKNGGMGDREEVGPLLTTAWHQGEPYNNSCPMGDGGRCVVGCVATAAAQVMKYHNWPPTGTGSHSYSWNGDQSCGGNVGGGVLSATFTDAYDWANMRDDCDGGCSQAEQDALTELCYEVGVAYEMDYGACSSSTWTSLALSVLPTYFRYDPSIDREDRDDGYTPESWFDLIKAEINAGRPIVYDIRTGPTSGHAIVCDGWRDTGGQNQYHMNYGWDDAGGFDTWYTIDNLHGSSDPMEEYLIRNIMPLAGNTPPILSNPCVVPTCGSESTEFEYFVDYYDPDGDPPDAACKLVFIDGDSHDMTLWTGTPSDGTYRYATMLDCGPHAYAFLFCDTGGACDSTPNYGGPTVLCGDDVVVTVEAHCEHLSEALAIDYCLSLCEGPWIDIPIGDGNPNPFTVPRGSEICFRANDYGPNYTWDHWERCFDSEPCEDYGSNGLGFTLPPSVNELTMRAYWNYTPEEYEICGTVLHSGEPVPGGVHLTLTSDEQTIEQDTAPDGSFSFTAVFGGITVTVTPSAPGYQFSPAVLVYPNLEDDHCPVSIAAYTGDVLAPTVSFLSLPPPVTEDRHVTFSWVGADDTSPPETLLYSYRLDGFDSDWSPWTSATTVSYDVPNQAYTFSVKTQDESVNIDQAPPSYTFVVNAEPRLTSATRIPASVWASRIAVEMPPDASDPSDTFVLLPQHAGTADAEPVPVTIHNAGEPTPSGAIEFVADHLELLSMIVTSPREGYILTLPDALQPGQSAEYDVIWGKVAYFGWQPFVNVASNLHTANSQCLAYLDDDHALWRLKRREIEHSNRHIDSYLYMSVCTTAAEICGETLLRAVPGQYSDDDNYEYTRIYTSSVVPYSNRLFMYWTDYHKQEVNNVVTAKEYRYGVAVFISPCSMIYTDDGEYRDVAYIYPPDNWAHLQRLYCPGSWFPCILATQFDRDPANAWFCMLSESGSEVVPWTLFDGYDFPPTDEWTEIWPAASTRIGADNVVLLWNPRWDTPASDQRGEIYYQVRTIGGNLVWPTTRLTPELLPPSVEQDDEYRLQSVATDLEGKVWISYDHDQSPDPIESLYAILGADGSVWKSEQATSVLRLFEFCDRDGYIWATEGGQFLVLNPDDTEHIAPRTPAWIPTQDVSTIAVEVDESGYRLYDRWSAQFSEVDVAAGVDASTMELFDLDMWGKDLHAAEITLDLNGCAVPFPPGVFTGHTSVDVSNCIEEGANLLTMTQEDFLGGQVLVTFPYVSRGACCLPDGSCAVETTESECNDDLGGIFQGADSVCDPNPCTGACCLDDEGCVADVTSDDCNATGGAWQGLETTCQPDDPCIGACCLWDGTCLPDRTRTECMDEPDHDSWLLFTPCEPNNPCEPLGGCCFEATGGCLVLNEDECVVAGGTWAGAGTDCTDADEDGVADECEGACCLSGGTCVATANEGECAALGGMYVGMGVRCEDIDCRGACCFAGGCVFLSRDDCGIAGGAWAGPGTDCTDADEDGVADACECWGDLDGDGDVDLADLAELLGNYGATCCMTYEDGDLQGCDGDVDLADLAELLGHYGDICE